MQLTTLISVLVALSAAAPAIAAPAASVQALTQRSNSLNSRAAATAATMPYRAIYADDFFGTPENTDYFPTAKELGPFNTVILSFFMSTGASDMAIQWTKKDQATREAILKDYHDNGKKIIVSAFGGGDQGKGGEIDPPVSWVHDPSIMADALIKYVKDYGLDGVDIDYEFHNNPDPEDTLYHPNGITFDTAGAKLDSKAEVDAVQLCADYLKKLHFLLRKGLGPDAIVSHTPMVHWFTNNRPYGLLSQDKEFVDDVTYLGMQYYNVGDLFTQCDEMMSQSYSRDQPWFEGISMDDLVTKGVPRSKLMIGKSLDGGGGKMTGKELNKCLLEYKKADKAPGGFVLWQYNSNNEKRPNFMDRTDWGIDTIAGLD